MERNPRHQRFFALSIKARYSSISTYLISFSVVLRSLILANGFRPSTKYPLGSIARVKICYRVRMSLFTVATLGTVGKRWATKASACRGLILDNRIESPIKFSNSFNARIWSCNVAYATCPFISHSYSSRNYSSGMFLGLSALPKYPLFCSHDACLTASLVLLKTLPYLFPSVLYHLTIHRCSRLLVHCDFGIGLPFSFGTFSSHLGLTQSQI